MSRLRSSMLLVVCLVTLAAVAVVPEQAGASRYKMSKRRISDGVTLIRITDSQGPNRIRVLEIDPTRTATIDVGLPSGTFPSYATTGQIARAYGAVGAVNGDFALFGHPLHPFIEDGQIQVQGKRLGFAFSVSQDEQSRYVGRRAVRSRVIARGSRQVIARWNFGDPRSDQLGAFTRQGGTIEAPPNHACQVRLGASDAPRWIDAERSGITRAYKVRERSCGGAGLSPGKHGSSVVLSSAGTTGPTANWVQGLAVGTSVRVEWKIRHWPGLTERIGGVPMLLEDGRVVAPASCGSYFCDRNPRTGVGTTPEGKVLFVTVDGRQPTSVGMTLPEFANVFKTLGATWAMNFDGGGSTTMLARYRGKLRLVNRPAVTTHRNQRPITSALLVLPNADPGVPTSLSGSGVVQGLAPAPPGASVGPALARQAWSSAVRDPGSTGGLLSATANGGLGQGPPLTPDLERIVREYRRAAQRS